MMWRGALLAVLPLVLVAVSVWAEKSALFRPPAEAAFLLLPATYLIGAAGIVTMPLVRTAKCWLGAIYTMLVVPGMVFVGLLTACAMGDCI